jgi:hypothetical protein
MTSDKPQGIIHIYAQYSWHEEAIIWGDRQALERLCLAISEALKLSKSKIEVWAADGEGYDIYIVKHDDGDENWDSWKNAAVPYTAEFASEKDDKAIYPRITE